MPKEYTEMGAIKEKDVVKGLNMDTTTELESQHAETKAKTLEQIIKLRDNPHPTSSLDILNHLVKAALGIEVLAMPKAFECAGLVTGFLFTLLVASICIHCLYVLVKCAHILYKRTGRHTMSYAEVAEECFKTGPKVSQKFAVFFKYLTPIGLFSAAFFTCCTYTVIVAGNIIDLLNIYGVHLANSELTSVRLVILCLLLPLNLMACVPNLHYLAPVSIFANVCMGIGLGVIFYDLLVGGNAMKDVDFKYVQNPRKWGEFFAITIFAFMAVGPVMPLENSARRPQAMLGTYGTINIGMAFAVIVFIMLGALGYIRYGSNVEDFVTLNDGKGILAQIAKVAFSVAVYCTFGLQFSVCLSVTKKMRNTFPTKECFERTVLVLVCVAIAATIPIISSLMSLIGAFCFSLFGLMVPVILETITLWDEPEGFGRYNWRIIKNISIFLFACMALVTGTQNAIKAIIISKYSFY